jgi:hypothetical protein
MTHPLTREEHLFWCKNRAREYLARGDVVNAVTSMLSDLSKHPETKGVGRSLALVGMLCISERDLEGARRFIDGFR